MPKPFEWPPAPTYRTQEPLVLPVAQTVVWHNPRWGTVDGTGGVGLGNGAQEDDADTMKSAERVPGLLARWRF